MLPSRLLLCGQNALLLHQLRTTAGPGAEIIQNADFQTLKKSNATNLVLIVHQPPEQDGLRALRSWKHHRPELPVVVVTTDYSGPATQLLFVSGADDVIEFPVTTEKLLSCLETYGSPAPADAVSTKAAGRIKGHAPQLPTRQEAPDSVFPAAPPAPDPDRETDPPSEAQPAKDSVQISFFGEFTIRIGRQNVALPHQAKLLLAYLAYHHPRVLAREHLSKAFWPDKYDTAPDSARRGLNVEITRIRNTFRALTGTDRDFVVFKNNCYRLDEGLSWQSDLIEFRELCRRLQDFQRQGREAPGELYLEAMRLFKGNFLEDFQESHYNWVDIERQRLGTDFERLADRYSELLCRQGDYWNAIGVCNEILSRDMRMEVIHRRLMECYCHAGSWPKVQQQYDLCCQMMEREFQCKPSPDTVRQFEEIRLGMNS